MKKTISKVFTASVLAAAMAVQGMTTTVLAFEDNIANYGFSRYFFLKGIYYSIDVDASDAAQRYVRTPGNNGLKRIYDVVQAEDVPKTCIEKWLDPITGKTYDTKYQAEVENGVANAHLIFVDPDYDPDEDDNQKYRVSKPKTDNDTEETSAETEDESDDNKSTDTQKPSSNAKEKKTTKTSSVKAGEPYISGRKPQTGWKAISESAGKLNKGSITITMNGCEEIDKSVIKAVKDKNVNAVFSFANGAKWTINGKNVKDAASISAKVEYNTKTISSELVKKVSEGAVTKTQLSVSDSEDSFGCTANITIKFDKKRADLVAAAYSYDTEKKSLKKVSVSKVKSDGSCTFKATKGGAYVIVLSGGGSGSDGAAA